MCTYYALTLLCVLVDVVHAQNLMNLGPPTVEMSSLTQLRHRRRTVEDGAMARRRHSNSSYSNASQMLEKLLEGYDIRLRPGFGGAALVLEMDIVIASFDSVSEVNMDYTVTMYLHQYWKDERLAFGDGRRDPDKSMTLSGDFAKSIWVPDTFLANDKNSFLHDVTETNKMLRLYNDGYIAYGMRFTSTLACHMNLRHYPLDSQKCTVEIESYGYTQSEVSMMWREGDASVRGVDGAEIPQFTIIKYQTANRSVTTSTGDYQRLSLEFYLQRSIGYFIFQTYLPCILIVMLSWVSFWINHEATSARVALGITTVLTMTTISTGVRQSLPRISYVKSIDIYLVMCFVFVFAALLEYAAVNYSYWGMKSKKKRRAMVMRQHKLSALGNGGMSDSGGQNMYWLAGGGMMPGGDGDGDGDGEMGYNEDGGGDGDDTEGRIEYPMLPAAYNPANEPRMMPAMIMLDTQSPARLRQPLMSPSPSSAHRLTTASSSVVRFSADEPSIEVARASTRDDEEEDELDDRTAIRRSLLEKGEQETSLIVDSTANNNVDEENKDSRIDDLHKSASPAHRVNIQTPAVNSGRMSPLPSLYQNRAQQSPGSPLGNHNTHASTHSVAARFDIDEFPDYPRMSTPGYQQPASTSSGGKNASGGLRQRTGAQTGRLKRAGNRRRAIASTFNMVRKRARSIVPRIRDINIIDKYSRVVFPSSFIIFNLVYWVYYALLAAKITDENAESS